MRRHIVISKLQSPCYQCPDRSEGCHGKCEKYIEFSKNETDLNEKDRVHRVATQTDPWGKRRRGS